MGPVTLPRHFAATFESCRLAIRCDVRRLRVTEGAFAPVLPDDSFLFPSSSGTKQRLPAIMTNNSHRTRALLNGVC